MHAVLEGITRLQQSSNSQSTGIVLVLENHCLKMLASGRERGVEVVIVARNTDHGGEGGKIKERSTELDPERKNIQRGECE